MTDTIETPAAEAEGRLATMLVAKQTHAALNELLSYLGDADRRRGLSPLEHLIARAAAVRLRREFTDHTC